MSQSDPSPTMHCTLWAALGAAVAVAITVGLLIESGPRPPQWTEPVQVTILHTNDIHGQILEPHQQPTFEGAPGDARPIRSMESGAGLVALGWKIRQERDTVLRRGGHVLLLDAGDLFKGTMEGDFTHGQAVVAWMNHLGYDAATVGNHEFDHGVPIAHRLALNADFPLLGANIIDAKTGKVAGWLGRGSEGELQGEVLLRAFEHPGGQLRVAVIGLTTSEMKEVTLKGVTEGLTFPDEAEVLESVLERLPPVDLVVLLTHCGLQTDEALAERFEGRVDVIIGGHSHDQLSSGKQVGDVLIAQTGSRARFLGRVQVTVSPPDPNGGRPRVKAEAALLPIHDDIHRILGPHIEKAEEKAAELAQKLGAPKGSSLLGSLEGPLHHSPKRPVSSALGNLLTDLMCQHGKAAIAFQNKGGIRAGLESGDVYYRDLYAVSPFENTLVTMTLKGSDIRELIVGMLARDRLLEVSGAVIHIDPDLPPEQRVLSIRIGDEPLHPTREYRVATNNFLSHGGDGHQAFTRGTKRKELNKTLRALLGEFLVKNNPYDPGRVDQRLVIQRPE